MGPADIEAGGFRGVTDVVTVPADNSVDGFGDRNSYCCSSRCSSDRNASGREVLKGRVMVPPAHAKHILIHPKNHILLMLVTRLSAGVTFLDP